MKRFAPFAGFILVLLFAAAGYASAPADDNAGMAAMHGMMHGSDGTGGMMGTCPMMQGGMGMGMMMVMMLLMVAFWIAAIAALIALTVFLVRKSRQLTPPTTPQS